jgi:hypothetical protein
MARRTPHLVLPSSECGMWMNEASATRLPDALP